MLVPFLLELLAERIGSAELYELLKWMLWCTEDAATTLQARTRRAIRAGLDLVLRDLKDVATPVDVRTAALAMIAELPEDGERWKFVLMAVCQTELSQDFRLKIQDVLAAC